MKNRAKCLKCNNIIESFHPTDYVECECGEISVSGGDAMRCCAVDWENFVRIDDNGDVVNIKIKTSNYSIDPTKPNKEQILKDLEALIATIDGLPSVALDTPITHRDYRGMLGLIATILRL